MIDFMLTNWDSLLVVIAFVVLVLYLLKKGAEKKVNSMLFYLVTEAEMIFGSGTGELKYASVVTALYDVLPTVLKILFTQKQIDNMINDAVEDLKEYLKRNPKAEQYVNFKY